MIDHVLARSLLSRLKASTVEARRDAFLVACFFDFTGVQVQSRCRSHTFCRYRRLTQKSSFPGRSTIAFPMAIWSGRGMAWLLDTYRRGGEVCVLISVSMSAYLPYLPRGTGTSHDPGPFFSQLAPCTPYVYHQIRWNVSLDHVIESKTHRIVSLLTLVGISSSVRVSRALSLVHDDESKLPTPHAAVFPRSRLRSRTRVTIFSRL